MSKQSKEKVQEKTTGIDDQDVLEKKEKLLSEIKALKVLILRIKSTFDTMTFKDVYKTQVNNVEETAKGYFSKPIDVEVVIQNELFNYAGLCCKKMGGELVFAFQSFEKDFCSSGNWIQLFKVGEHWQLGQWVTPLSIDIKSIFAKYSINSASSMKLFLRECKHRIDCYNRRKQEFQELETFLESLPRSYHSVESNYGYTRTIIKLVRCRRACPDEARNIHVYLIYKDSEARPWKLQIESDNEKKLSENEMKDLRALFKGAKEQNLKDAVERALMSEGSPFIWQQDSENNSATDEDGGDEVETSFSKFLKKKPAKKALKKRGKAAAETDENENEIIEDDDRRESDLSIDAVNRSSEIDASQLDTPKPDKKKSKAIKKSPRKKSLQSKPKAANPKAGRSKSKTSQASAKKSSPLKLQSDNKSDLGDTARGDLGGESSKNYKATKLIVPEMFTPKTKQLTKVSKVSQDAVPKLQKSVATVNKEVETPSRKRTERLKRIGTRGRKSTSHSYKQLACSTPIAEGAGCLSNITEENISAINRESMIIAKRLEATKRNEDIGAKEPLVESDSAESESNNVTTAENDQRELLKDLQAVQYNSIATKKAVKRKAKSPLRGKKKTARK